jgi:drug/metabolite transporter (DMT)-like permease
MSRDNVGILGAGLLAGLVALIVVAQGGVTGREALGVFLAALAALGWAEARVQHRRVQETRVALARLEAR